MNVREFYETIGSSYEEVFERLMKDDRIVKYLRKFALEDEYVRIEKYLDANDAQEAFRCVHSVKGMCLNLGLSKLCTSSAVLCDELRNGIIEGDISDKVKRFKDDYYYIVAKIKELDDC